MLLSALPLSDSWAFPVSIVPPLFLGGSKVIRRIIVRKEGEPGDEARQESSQRRNRGQRCKIHASKAWGR